jgi:hypothetical protein
MGSNVAMRYDVPDLTKEIPENSLPSTAYEHGPHFYVRGRVEYETFAKDGTHFTSFCLLSAGKATGAVRISVDCIGCSGGDQRLLLRSRIDEIFKLFPGWIYGNLILCLGPGSSEGVSS